MSDKKLVRSRTDQMLAGVCGGLGEYLGLDPTVVRLVFVLVTVFLTWFTGPLIYLIFAVLMPRPD